MLYPLLLETLETEINILDWLDVGFCQSDIAQQYWLIVAKKRERKTEICMWRRQFSGLTLLCVWAYID